MLEVIEIRNKRIREVNAQRIADGQEPIPKCVVRGCPELRDSTKGLGAATSCPYHRLLFDYWLYEVCKNIQKYKTRAGRRSAVTRWANQIGKKECDRIVDVMSRVPINWEC